MRPICDRSAFLRGCVVAFAVGAPLAAEQVLFSAQGWTVSAADTIDCSKPIVLPVRGPSTLFDPSNRAVLQAVTLGIGPGLAHQCPGLSEVVLISGRTRRLVALSPVAVAPSTPETAAIPTPSRPVIPPKNTPTSPERSAVPARPVTEARPGAEVAVTAKSVEIVARRYQDRRLQSLDSVKDIEEKCELLSRWLGRFKEEYPEPALNVYLHRQAQAYLYRDEDFVQVFGLPYDQTTIKWRADIHDKVIRRCQGFTPTSGLRRTAMRTYVNQFEPFQIMLDGAFAGEQNQLSPDAITAAITRARESRAWMERTLSGLSSLSINAASFHQLTEYQPRDDSENGGRSAQRSRNEPRSDSPLLTALWPSEQKYLLDAIAKQRTHIAMQVASQWVLEIDSFGPTLIDAARLRDVHQQQQKILAAVDTNIRDQAAAKYDSKLSSILAPLVGARLQTLAALPGTLSGAAQSLAWYENFARDFKPYLDHPSVASFREAYRANRNRVLASALPEWKRIVAADPATNVSLAELKTKLENLIPSEESTSQRSEYEGAFAVLSGRKQEADYAVAVGKCDNLAAHPQDPEAVAAGVSDQRLNVPYIILACEDAIKRRTAAPRLHFQLARAYLTIGRIESGIEQLLAAAQEGHGASLAYLADLHIDGARGIDADAELAYSLYERAAEAGFAPAKMVLAEFKDVSKEVAEADKEEQEQIAELKKTNPELFVDSGNYAAGPIAEEPVDLSTIDFTKFSAPKVMRILLAEDPNKALADQDPSNLNAATFSKALVGAQIASSFQFLGKQDDPACQAIVSRFGQRVSLMAALTAKKGSEVDLFFVDREGSIEAAKFSGDIDMGTLVYEYGGCANRPMQRYTKNLDGLLNNLGEER